MRRLIGIPVLVFLFATQGVAQQAQVVCLTGTSEEIGNVWGGTNQTAIARDLDNYLRKAKAAGVSPEALVKRSSRFVEISRRVAPHWLVEARTIARAAGVPEDLYISFIANVYRDLHLHECTSYAVSRDRTKANAIFFHKNRDNVEKDQAAFIMHNSTEGLHKFISVSDASVVACMMMVNEKGLAGSADYPGGSLPEPAAPQFRGIMNTFLLRYIAERASDCESALQIIRDFVDKRYYAGGEVDGTHWLFVDKSGTIMEVSSNTRHVKSAIHAKTVYFSRRQSSAAAERLRQAHGPVDFMLFHSVSRDPSICLASSIAGMTVEIDPDFPELFTCAWISLPARGVAFPLLMSQTRTPAVLVNGKAHSLGKKVKDQRRLWKAVETAVHGSKDLLKAQYLADPKGSAEIVDLWTRRQANMLVTLLQALP